MPELTRRAAPLLGVGTLGISALSGFTNASAEVLAPRRPNGLAPRSAFACALGADFQARGATGSTELSFILIFQAAGGGPGSGTFRLTTRGVPAGDLYLSSGAPQTGAHRLQAVVNR